MQGTQLDDIKQKRAMRLMEHLHSSAQFEHLFDFLGKYRWEILRQLPNDPLPTFIHYEPCTKLGQNSGASQKIKGVFSLASGKKVRLNLRRTTTVQTSVQTSKVYCYRGVPYEKG